MSILTMLTKLTPFFVSVKQRLAKMELFFWKHVKSVRQYVGVTFDFVIV